jgi:hypothetical protein
MAAIFNPNSLNGAARTLAAAHPSADASALTALLRALPQWAGASYRSAHNACRAARLSGPVVAPAKPAAANAGELLRTDLGTDYGVHVMSAADFSALLKDYSREWEGKALNQDQLAVKYGFANAHAVARFVKIHGIRQTSSPFTAAEMAVMSPEEAAALAAGTWKKRYYQIAHKRRFDEVAKDAAKWNNFDDNVLAPLIEAVQRSLPTFYLPKLNLAPDNDPFGVVTGPADWHYMKQAYDHTGAQVYNKKLAVSMLTNATEDLIAQVLAKGAPDVVHYLSGNDGMHVDNGRHTTTKGTEQAAQTEGSYAVDFDLYLDTRIANIARWAQVAPVEVWEIPGNHDEQTSLAVRRALEEVFKHHPRVTVHRCYDPRQYATYGANAFLFGHGDAVKNLKGQLHKMALVEGRQQGVDMNKAVHWHAMTGHLHTDEYADLGGIKHFGMPSLCATDAWHKKSGYIGNAQEMPAYLFHPTRGRRGILYADGL